MRPMTHSDEILVPIFDQLTPLEDLNGVEECSDCNEANFEIYEDSVRRGFDQHVLNDLARDLGFLEKASEILASRLNKKNLLEQRVKVSYFRTRKSKFRQYFEVTAALYFAITFPVYWRN